MNLKLNVPSWMKKAAPAVVVAVVFGVAGYMITPQSAQSESLRTRQSLSDVQGQLKKAQAHQKKLDEQLSQTEDKLALAVERAEAAAEAAEAKKVKLATAEKFIAQLNTQLDQAQQASESARKGLTDAKRLAADSKAQADQARSRAEGLTVELAAVRKDKQKLNEARNSLGADRTKLAGELTSQQQTTAELKRLLAVLDFGEEQVSQPSPAGQAPAERPITTGELIRRLGYPNLIFQRLDHVEMHWRSQKAGCIVRASDGIVTEIDGKAADRVVLGSIAPVRSAPISQPGPWRMDQSGNLYYADLVALFGRPDRVTGTGARFTARWAVGAWARTVSATVADGVVTEIDECEPDGEICCELVRHRIGAYKSPTDAVQANAAAAGAAYGRAVTVVGQRLQEEADLRTRDGIELLRWNVAPLESVGTWIAPANASAGSVTVRAWVDCTWKRLDGSTTDERRYVVVTFGGKKGKPTDAARCAIFASRD